MDTYELTGEPYQFVPDGCANCLGALPDEVEGLYCSSLCRETAKHVRYIRAVSRDDRRDDPEVARTVAVRLHVLQIGGSRPGFTTAYFQQPDELGCEVASAGLRDVSVLGVEGPGVPRLLTLSEDCSTISKTRETGTKAIETPLRQRPREPRHPQKSALTH